jgi:hypothetical protein
VHLIWPYAPDLLIQSSLHKVHFDKFASPSSLKLHKVHFQNPEKHFNNNINNNINLENHNINLENLQLFITTKIHSARAGLRKLRPFCKMKEKMHYPGKVILYPIDLTQIKYGKILPPGPPATTKTKTAKTNTTTTTTKTATTPTTDLMT